MTLSLFTAAFLVLVSTPTPSISQRPHNESQKKIAALATHALESSNAASLSVAVFAQGALVFNQAFGYANIELKSPASPDSAYKLASISKQFTAAAVFQLIEKGEIGLEDNINKYIEIETFGQKITIRDLLQHSSGLKSFTEVTAAYRRLAPLDASREEILALIRGQPLLFPPGHGYSYSNTNYFILAAIIERVSGTSFRKYIEERVIAPAGLRHTCFCDTEALVPNRTNGYRLLYGTQPVNARFIHLSSQYGHSGICSTAADLIQWTNALRRGQVISPWSYEQMIRPGASPSYGFAMQIGELEGQHRFYHGGDTAGYNATLALYPKADLIIAVLANTEDAGTSILAEQIARSLLGLPALAAPQDLPLSENEAQRYLGEYTRPRMNYLFKYMNSHLVQTANGLPESEFSVLLYQGDNVFVFKNSMRFLKFMFDGNPWKASGVTPGDGKTWEASFPAHSEVGADSR